MDCRSGKCISYVWAGDGHHLSHFDGNGFTLVNKPGLDDFVSVKVDRHHQLWIASGGLPA